YEATISDSAIGIGENMLLSKLSLDIEAKKMNDGIAEWRYHDVPEKLWPITPLRDFWGLNRRSAVKLNQRGIFNIGDLARYNPVHLKRDLSVVGADWHLHATGIDLSVIREKHDGHSPSIAKRPILVRDYEFQEIYDVLYEQIDDVAHRLRLAHRRAKTVQYSVGTKDGEVFRKQFPVKEGINNENDMMKMVWRHLLQMADTEALYRTISVALTNFIPDSVRQVSLFEDMEKVLKEEALVKTIDELKVKYGQLSVMRALSRTEASTLKLREGLIAGHKR